MLLEGLEISEILLSEVFKKENHTQRIDSEYFKKEYLKTTEIIEKQQFDILSNIGQIKGGKRLPLGENFSEEGVPYIRAQDIKNGFIDYSNSPKISLKLHKVLQRYQTKNNDVLITNVGNSIGDVGIVKFDLDKCNLTENAVKVISEKVLPEFLFIFLLSKYGNYQISRETVGTAQPKLALERINLFKVPLLSLEFQNKIKELVNNAYSKKEQSQSLYCKAEELLVEALGIDSRGEKFFAPTNVDSAEYSSRGTACRAPTPTNNDNNTTTTTNHSIKNFSESFLATGRLDAEYYQPKYEEMEKYLSKFETVRLNKIVKIKKSIEPGSDAYQDTGIPFIRVSNLSKFGLNETDIYLDKTQYGNLDLLPKKDTILLSKDGSVGIAYKIEKDLEIITSGALLHLTVQNTDFLPDYLTLVLNSNIVKMQAERDAGGSIIQHWKPSEIEQVIIPKLPMKIQQEIADLIQESFSLRSESERLLEEAKEIVEREVG